MSVRSLITLKSKVINLTISLSCRKDVITFLNKIELIVAILAAHHPRQHERVAHTVVLGCMVEDNIFSTTQRLGRCGIVRILICLQVEGNTLCLLLHRHNEEARNVYCSFCNFTKACFQSKILLRRRNRSPIVRLHTLISSMLLVTVFPQALLWTDIIACVLTRGVFTVLVIASPSI